MNAALLSTIILSASTTTARLGEPVTVTAVLPTEVVGVDLDLEKSTTDSFAIGKVEKASSERMTVEVLPLAVGRLPVALFFKTAGPGGTTLELSAAPLILEVAEPPIEGPGEFKDIKPPFRARTPVWPWLLLAAAAAAAVWAWRRRGRAAAAPTPTEIPDDRPPEAWISEQLDRLEASGDWEEGRYKQFYGRLTEVLRAYLERRLALSATRMTTTELLRALRKRALCREAFLPLAALSERADLVKFSRQTPQPGWGALDLEGARRIVRELSPKEPAAAGQKVP